MLVNNKPSYTVQSGGTYSPDTPIDINPESIGNAESSYRFVEPIGGGVDPITDYVSKANGGTFQNLIMYPSALSITGNYDIVYKTWVDDAISTAIGGGSTVDYSLARPYFSVANSATSPLSYESSTGVFTLNRYLSKYVNDTGYITTYTVTESDVTAHETALTIDASQVTGLSTALSSSFNTLFDARFAISSLASLGTRTHQSLTSLPGSSEGYHLSLAQYTTVTQAADSTHNGYLTSTDWTTFNSKLSALSAGTGINYAGGVISTKDSEIVHNNLSGYSIVYHRSINDSGTSSTDLWSASKIRSYTEPFTQIYTIKLKAGTSIAQRVTGLVEGTDYPTGWSAPSADGTSLVITHSLNKIATTVTVVSINGTTSDAVKLEGHIACSTLTNVYYSSGYNRIKLDTFNVDGTVVHLKIIL